MFNCNHLHRYLDLYPKEKEDLKTIKLFFDFFKTVTDVNARINKKTMPEHITASCLLVDAIKKRILLFKHPRYHRYLQPGGHFENSDEFPWRVAIRKLGSETEYSQEHVKYLPFDFDLNIPIDIDRHVIPASQEKNEDEHYHFDLRYVFLAIAGKSLSSPYVWYDLSDLRAEPSFERLHEKLEYFLSYSSARKRFYIELTREFNIAKKVDTLIVTHILPDSGDFLYALSRFTNLKGVIAKPKSMDSDTASELRTKGIPFLDIDRNAIIENPSILNQYIGDRAVLLDIGGWFVPALKDLPKSVIGVVEDTRNGQNKYEQFADSSNCPFPVVTLAESTLKENEDFLVGQSIVFSADAVLREQGIVLEYFECSVIGYGKIGRSIAYHLQQRGIKPYILEINPLRRLRALREKCKIHQRNWTLQNTEIIFCATGNRSLCIQEFQLLRPGSFVFSVTSADDEFDFKDIETYYTKTPISKNIDRFWGEKNHFYLVNEGNAVNFLHKAVLWEFIQLVKGGIFVAMKNLIENQDKLSKYYDNAAMKMNFDFLRKLSEEDEKKIATLWMETILLGIEPCINP